MEKSNLFIEFNKATGKDLTVEEQEDPYLMAKVVSTECRDVSDEEIEEAKKYFEEHKKCRIHICKDTAGFIYDSRDCVICNRFIAHI